MFYFYESALCIAIEKQNTEIVNILLEQEKINVNNYQIYNLCCNLYFYIEFISIHKEKNLIGFTNK